MPNDDWGFSGPVETSLGAIHLAYLLDAKSAEPPIVVQQAPLLVKYFPKAVHWCGQQVPASTDAVGGPVNTALDGMHSSFFLWCLANLPPPLQQAAHSPVTLSRHECEGIWGCSCCCCWAVGTTGHWGSTSVTPAAEAGCCHPALRLEFQDICPVVARAEGKGKERHHHYRALQVPIGMHTTTATVLGACSVASIDDVSPVETWHGTPCSADANNRYNLKLLRFISY